MAKPEAAPAPLRMTTALDDLARLYPWLDDAAKPFALPPKLLERMHVALEEAVMNVAMHGYRDGDGGEIIVRLQIEVNEAVLLVQDHGPPFDPIRALADPRQTNPGEAKAGGFGLKLLRHFCKDISYAREADSNRLTLRFALQAS